MADSTMRRKKLASARGRTSSPAFRRPILQRPVPERATQERAIHTRHELLKAARLIFARDGFEVARLQDIAEAAGKTRGALYDNFKNKEDIFFALIAQDISRDNEAYERQLTPRSSRAERIRVLTEQLVALVHDRQRMLLYIDFKLFAVRHPHEQARLAELHRAMCCQGINSRVDLIPELQIEDPDERRRAVASFAAVLDGLALNLYFDPIGSSEAEIRSRIESAVREHFIHDRHAGRRELLTGRASGRKAEH